MLLILTTNQTVLFLPQIVLFLITRLSAEYVEKQCLNLTAVELDYENDTKSGKTLLLMPDMFVQTIIYHYNPEIYILKPPRKRLDS